MTLAVALVAGAAGWAGAVVLVPPPDPLDAASHTYVTVESGEVGSALSLNSLATWEPQPVGINRAVGVVTSVDFADGNEATQGSTLYTVGLRPVVVAQGAVPAFRSISPGVSGPDVAQLQDMLRALGFYAGAADGNAQGGTERAVRSWQRSLGVPVTGVVEAGDIIFVPVLPSRLVLDGASVSRGAVLGGGEQVVRALGRSPRFTVPVTPSQSDLIKTGTEVRVSGPDGVAWTAFVAERTRDEAADSVILDLAGRDGGAVCGDECGLVPVTGEPTYVSQVVTVPTVTGLVVPSAALVTDAEGTVGLIDEAGRSVPVRVLASARGMSIVEGVAAGLRVRVPGESK